MSEEDKCKFCPLPAELTLKIKGEGMRLCSHCCTKFYTNTNKMFKETYGIDLGTEAQVIMDRIRCEECGYDWVMQLFTSYNSCVSCGSGKIVKYQRNGEK